MESKTIESVLRYLCDELGGSWLLTGGALVCLSFDANRGTEDIDLVRIGHPELSDEAGRNLLFKWLMVRGLGPEWVNTAVEPFVKEVEGWQSETVPLRKGLKGEVVRPNLTLFTYLKLRRGTEVDLGDVRAAAKNCPEGFDESRLLSWSSPEMRARFRHLRPKLGL